MDYKSIQDAIMSYFTVEVLLAIKEQDELMSDMQNKQGIYEKTKSRIIDLYLTGFEKLKKIDIKNPIQTDGKDRFEIGNEVIKAFLENKPEYQNFVNAMNSIPEISEASALEKDMAIALMDFYQSFIKFNNKVLSDREILFSKAYQDKIDDYAYLGWFFYFLASPDLPLLHDFCDEKYICESFVANDCMNIKILLSNWLNQNNLSDSMKRKAQDLSDIINLISNGGFRTAARSIFALLESESKNCSNAWRNLEFKTQNLRTGEERATEIQKLISAINIEWYKVTFDKLNSYYKKATSKEITPGIINRNALIHGDYYKESIDVTVCDTIKLLLLFINYRVVSDFVQYVIELEADMFQYAIVAVASRTKRDR